MGLVEMEMLNGLKSWMGGARKGIYLDQEIQVTAEINLWPAGHR
jgi:hypothetical protein